MSMPEDYCELLSLLYSGMPEGFLLSTLLLFCGVSTIILLIFKRKGLKAIPVLAFLVYTFLFISSAIIFRETSDSRRFNLTPYWLSGSIFREGFIYIAPELLFNVLAFIPIGLLIGMVFRDLSWFRSIIGGASFSLIIEVTQFYSRRGFFEINDIINNTVGCAIGYGAYRIAIACLKRKQS